MIAETDGAGDLLAHYVRGDEELLSVVRPAGPRFYHADGLGSVRHLTDETGTLTDTYRYNAFGKQLEHVGSDPNPYRFAGEPVGPTGRFSYNRARWLDPTTGRFLSVDPFEGFLDDPSTLHRYSYASNDPVNFTDPTGEYSYQESFVSQAVANIFLVSAAAYLGNQALTDLAHQEFVELAEKGCFTVAQLKNRRDALPAGKKWIHHIIEKRLMQESEGLWDMYDGKEDNIPGVPLSKAHHIAYRSLWTDDKCGIRQRTSVTQNRKFGLDEILTAAAWVYTQKMPVFDKENNNKETGETTYHPEYYNAILGCD